MTETARPLPKGYDFVREIGAGGCGEVVLARHTALKRLVAVKRIHGYALADADALERFRREAQVLATLDDPTVVRVFDFRRSGHDATLVMEYVPGESLADMIERGPLPFADALVILRDAADALRIARERGIVHRDVKPGNVFVLPNGRAKLGDFGLARIVSDPSVFRTSTGDVSGTPAYFPPECGSADNEPDERSDAYSFAVMAYELLTGVLPFTGDDIMQIVTAHLSKSPPPPETVLPGFPAPASAAILAGLAKDPAQRLLPWELVDRLEAVPTNAWPTVNRAAAHANRPVPKSAPTVRVAPDAVPAASPGATTAASPPRRRRRDGSRRIGIVAAAVVVAAAAAVLAIHFLSGSSSTSSAEPLHVTGVSLTVLPPDGRARCPSGHFEFSARIATNGAGGDIVLRWTRPDGRDSAPTTVAVSSGQRAVTAVLRFDVSGERPLQGRAVVHVVTPDARDATSTPIAYTC
ncbi:MAG: eukaryotic-like serine/threonine-protein kinase [Frankiales bacterium]|jgi:serine/threonine-protein kinase|nr:eukaryotic-like serine/threonine-protein kinase [Frankiales bacterium]